jgi:hypothetical protein
MKAISKKKINGTKEKKLDCQVKWLFHILHICKEHRDFVHYAWRRGMWKDHHPLLCAPHSFLLRVCLSLFLLLQQNTLVWVICNNRYLLLIVLESGKSKIKTWTDWGSGEGCVAPRWCRLCVLTIAEGVRWFSQDFSNPIPFAFYLLKTSSLNTKFNLNFGGLHSHHCISWITWEVS